MNNYFLRNILGIVDSFSYSDNSESINCNFLVSFQIVIQI